jgi:hypothetical protein
MDYMALYPSRWFSSNLDFIVAAYRAEQKILFDASVLICDAQELVCVYLILFLLPNMWEFGIFPS